MTTYRKIILVELIITLGFYSVVAFHWLAPREWGWLDREQLGDVMTAGIIWYSFMLYDSWKNKKMNKN